MSVTQSTLVHVAGLVGSVPHLTVSLDTHSGGTVIVGDFPEATLCSHAFRQVVAQWPDTGQHQPCVEAIHFDGAHERGPVLATGPVRWFVTELSSQRAVVALRGVRGGMPGVSVQVRFDTMLGVSIVRIEADNLEDEVLDEMATHGYAACLTEHLILEGASAA